MSNKVIHIHQVRGIASEYVITVYDENLFAWCSGLLIRRRILVHCNKEYLLSYTQNLLDSFYLADVNITAPKW